MIIKLFKENDPTAPFATKSDVEAALERIAKASGSKSHCDVEQLVEDVENMRTTILVARSLLLHEDLTAALFLAQKISDEQFELSESFKLLINKFNEGTKLILQGARAGTAES